MDLNVLIRGQSNALLFSERGGAAALEQGLESRLGVDVHLLYQWGTDTSTIWSGTAFMDWDTDGEQASLLRYVNGLSADLKDNPTATVWMHNEYDQQNYNLSTDQWLGEVRADAAMVRDALGQGAETTPYTFVPIRYPYGGNFGAIGDGMAALDADGSFNAGISWEAQSLTMDGDGYANSSHMGNGDAVWLGGKLAESMAETLRPLANGGVASPPVTQPPVVQPPADPVALAAGSGADSLVLKISQDAYQGSAQYTVTVDGKQVGGTFTAAASHASGQSDTLTLKGDWGPGAHQVEVKFLNDAWGGSAAADRNLHVDSATFNGKDVAGAAQEIASDWKPGGFAFTEAAAPPVVLPPAAPVILSAGSGADALVLKISQDAYQGSAQYTVTVDGKQVGGTFTASALHGSGQSDTLTLKGDWGAGAHQVEVEFLNDAWGGTAADRNLHLDGATFNGKAVDGVAAALMGAGATGFAVAGTAVAQPGQPGLSMGTGPDALVLKISQDAYLGDAQYVVTVDGVQVGGTCTAAASHASGQSDTLTVKGDWGAGAHQVEVKLLNDAWGGSAAADRNLHVDAASYNGVAIDGVAQKVSNNWKAGDFAFTDTGSPIVVEPQPPLTAGSGPDALVLKISQDAYQGSAQYTVKVDGKQIGGTFTAAASRASGQSDTLTLKGDWGPGAHQVEVKFLNDAWGGSAAADRNLHVDSATFNGKDVAGAAQEIASDWKPGAFAFIDSTALPADPEPNPGTGGSVAPAGGWVESFEGGSWGRFTHAWGDIEGQDGQVVLRGGFSGMMEVPNGTSAGDGYGLREVVAKFEGGIGAAIVLWPGDDLWPGQEIDIGEINGSRDGQYAAVHWKGENGEDAYNIFDLGGDFRGAFHTYGINWEPGLLEFYVDGDLKASTTEHVPVDHAHGGLDDTLGWLSGIPQWGDGNGVITVSEARFTPWDGVA